MDDRPDIWREMQLAPLGRAQVALFAGGSGDHNPIHIDLDEARSAGFDDVFGQGMLSMALLGRLISDGVAPARLRAFRARFEAPYRIGDALLLRATVAERFIEMGEGRLRLELSGAAGERIILRGEAVLAEGGVDE